MAVPVRGARGAPRPLQRVHPRALWLSFPPFLSLKKLVYTISPRAGDERRRERDVSVAAVFHGLLQIARNDAADHGPTAHERAGCGGVPGTALLLGHFSSVMIVDIANACCQQPVHKREDGREFGRHGAQLVGFQHSIAVQYVCGKQKKDRPGKSECKRKKVFRAQPREIHRAWIWGQALHNLCGQAALLNHLREMLGSAPWSDMATPQTA